VEVEKGRAYVLFYLSIIVFLKFPPSTDDLRKTCQVRLEIVFGSTMKMAVCWVVAPCSLVGTCRRFASACCLHNQDDVIARLHGTIPQKTIIFNLRQDSRSPHNEPPTHLPKRRHSAAPDYDPPSHQTSSIRDGITSDQTGIGTGGGGGGLKVQQRSFVLNPAAWLCFLSFCLQRRN
jgi:hypothetical protein